MLVEVGLLAASVAGILSFLSPCVLPLVPPYLCFLAGTSLDELRHHSEDGTALRASPVARRAFARALAFVLGFALVFVALGASTTLLGRLIADHLALFTRIAGIIVVVLGLHMLGFFRSSLLMRTAQFTVTRRPATLLGAFVVGFAFAFGWTPCVGPVLATVLLVAGASESEVYGVGLLAAYAAGLGVPFLLAALFADPFLGFLARFRRHVGVVEKTMGAGLVATGVAIFVGAMPVLAGWLLDLAPALGQIG